MPKQIFRGVTSSSLAVRLATEYQDYLIDRECSCNLASPSSTRNHRDTLIHIGMPKCASSWLQQQFFKPDNGFRRKYGPLEAKIAFADAGNEQWKLPPNAGSLTQSGKLVPTITGEMLAGNPMTGGADTMTILHRLRRTLPQAKVLIIIREQCGMLRSLYQLLVNWGHTETIKTLLKNPTPPQHQKFSLDYLCYHKTISAYQDAFGEDRILVLTFEQFKSNPAAFLSSIQNFCGLDPCQYPVNADLTKVVNPGRNLASLNIKRLHNRFIARTETSPAGFYRPENIQGAGNVDINIPSVLDEWMERRFESGVSRKLGEYYATSNRKTKDLTGIKLADWGYTN